MKYIISLILVLCITESVLAQEKGKDTFSVVNPEGQILYYQILSETAKTVVLVKGKYKDEQYIIPETVSYQGRKYTVTEIGKWAFAYCRTLKKVSLPNSLIRIGKYAFYSASALSSVTFNEGLEEIGDNAFSLASINVAVFSGSIKEVGKGAFLGNSMHELNLPDNLHKIGKDAFRTSGSRVWKRYSGLIKNLPSWVTAGNCEEYGIDKEAFNAFYNSKLAQQQATPQVIYVQSPTSIDTPAPVIAASSSSIPSSDVDTDIPSNPLTNANTFAVVIGNENYQRASKVSYALNDAQIFAAYCQKTLGIPINNIRRYKDATYGTMLSALKDIKNIANAYNGDISIIFYYAGHGVPNEANKNAYLLPIDADGTQPEVCLATSRLYQELEALHVRSVVVFMDACFSGAQRGEGMLASARGVALKVNTEVPQGNIVVFSAASGDETAFPYKEKGHGMFTYFLLKKLQESKGEVALGELGDYITTNVKQQSVVVNHKSQTPTVVSSVSLRGNWETMRLR